MRAGGEPGSEALPDGFEQAPRIRRVAAASIDAGVACLPLLFSADLPPWLALFSGSWPLSKVMQLTPALYLLLRDALDGRSIGKAITGLQVIEVRERRPANIVDSIVRNGWLGLVTMPWIGPPIAIAWMSLTGAQVLLGAPRRFGEGFAATRVVRARTSQTASASRMDRRPTDE